MIFRKDFEMIFISRILTNLTADGLYTEDLDMLSIRRNLPNPLLAFRI